MRPDYDKIAWCYDLLGYIVFGNTIQKAQTDMLNFIPPGCRVLIAGGGTGRILERISQLHASGLLITYVDSSKKMIEKSRKRNIRSNQLRFICNKIEEINPQPGDYDVIITPFFFDNFPQSKCLSIFQKLNESLKTGGKWLFSDFEVGKKTKYWQKSLLKFMYFFFRTICNLEARQLPAINRYFLTYRYKKLSEKMYWKGFITSRVFVKT